jgi:hypothetical protein
MIEDLSDEIKNMSQLGDSIRGLAKDFFIEGIFFEGSMRVVIFGEVNLASMARLQAILDGLLILCPSNLVVEFDAVTDPEILNSLSHYESDEVEFLRFRARTTSPTAA